MNGQDHIETPVDENAKFELRYEDLVVGFLELRNGVWEFRYSDEFRMQSDLNTLVDFPDKNKVYQSPHLWPFFLIRIPSMAQPKVQDMIKKEGIDQKNNVQLLRLFGERSIANPYTLRPA